MERRDKQWAIGQLRRCLDAIDPSWTNPDSSGFTKWLRDTDVALTRVFGEKSRHRIEFRSIRFDPTYDVLFSDGKPEFRRGIENSKEVLESMIEEIETGWDEEKHEMASSSDRDIRSIGSKKIFIVHGHDESARKNVAKLLRTLNLEPIILDEQPNKGRTLIQKFQDHSDVGFAVVLLTQDDECISVRDGNTPKFRARQNAILELGFFLGKLGQDRICLLVEGDDIENPSDYSGVGYTSLDEGGKWRDELIQELKEAGFDIGAK